MRGLDLSLVCTLRSFLSLSARANMLSSPGSRSRSADGEEAWANGAAWRLSRDCMKTWG